MEKQIEEMIRIMCETCSSKCEDTSGCIVEVYARRLYDAGYRKGIEVQNED